MSRAAALVPVVCCLLAACGGDGEQAQAPASPFAYERSRPLELQDAGRVNRDYPVEIRDVSFVAAGRRVRAFLVLPPGPGPFPAVVYAHGSGQDRIAFLPEATWLGGRRVVALVLDQPPRPAASGSPLALIQAERRNSVRVVVELRRALDVLQSLEQVDAGRLGFVGYSAGARAGALFAGAERRLDAVALASAGAEPVQAYVEQLPAELSEDAARLLSDVDPLRSIRRAGPARLLLQDGRRDEVVPRAALQRLATAASRPKEVRWYDAGHGLNVAAVRERLDWLVRELGATGKVPGALTGPE